MEQEKKTITIYSYRKVWKVEKKIYSISNIQLPAPINPNDLGAFLGVAFIILVLGKIFPFIAAIPVVLRCIIFPYGIAQYLMKTKFDGKNPFVFLKDLIVHWISEKGQYLQQFCKNPERQQKVILNWNCSVGR